MKRNGCRLGEAKRHETDPPRPPRRDRRPRPDARLRRRRRDADRRASGRPRPDHPAARRKSPPEAHLGRACVWPGRHGLGGPRPAGRLLVASRSDRDRGDARPGLARDARPAPHRKPRRVPHGLGVARRDNFCARPRGAALWPRAADARLPARDGPRAGRPSLRPRRQDRAARPHRAAASLRDARLARLRRRARRSALQELAVPDRARRAKRRRAWPLLRQRRRGDVRPRLRARQLFRSLSRLRGRRRRPRSLSHPRPAHRGRHPEICRADRPHGPAAALVARLRADRHGARRRGRCASADRGRDRSRKGARRSHLGLSFRLGLHVDRQEALRLHLEPPKIPGPEGFDPRLRGRRHEGRRQPETVPARRPSPLRRGRGGRRLHRRRRRRAAEVAILGRRGRACRLHQSGRRRVVEGVA